MFKQIDCLVINGEVLTTLRSYMLWHNVDWWLSSVTVRTIVRVYLKIFFRNVREHYYNPEGCCIKLHYKKFRRYYILAHITCDDIIFLVVKGPAADATDAPQPCGFLCNPMMKMTMIIFCHFPSNGAPVEWNWQGKTEVLGGKPVPVPLCPSQIPHWLTRVRTRASAVGGRRLTAWPMERSSIIVWSVQCKAASVSVAFNRQFFVWSGN
jgi:hypothetical protein